MRGNHAVTHRLAGGSIIAANMLAPPTILVMKVERYFPLPVHGMLIAV